MTRKAKMGEKVVKEIVLSKSRPRTSPSPYGGYTEGVMALIIRKPDGYYYCFTGVGPGGVWSESDDVGPFASAKEAEREALIAHEEIQREEERWRAYRKGEKGWRSQMRR